MAERRLAPADAIHGKTAEQKRGAGGARALGWRRLACGLCLSAGAGMILGQAWTSQEGGWWWLGAMTLLSATLMVLSGLYAGTSLEVVAQESTSVSKLPRHGPIAQRWEIEPMLGEILVEKRLITPGELNTALVRQKGSGLLLGEILVEMGLISLDRLEEALQEQSEWRYAQGLGRRSGQAAPPARSAGDAVTSR